jgi:hypothetical protein
MSGLYGAMNQLRDYFDRVIPAVHEENEMLILIEKDKVIASMERLVAIQCGIMLEKEKAWDVAGSNMVVPCAYRSHESNGERVWLNTTTSQSIRGEFPPESPFHWEKTNSGWLNKLTNFVVQSERNPGFGKVNWESLSQHDWFTIIPSILLLTYNKHFCKHFGQEIVMLERTMCHGNVAKARMDSATAKRTNDFILGSYSNGVFKPDDEIKYRLVMQIETPERLSNPKHWGHLAWKFCDFVERVQAKRSTERSMWRC